MPMMTTKPKFCLGSYLSKPVTPEQLARIKRASASKSAREAYVKRMIRTNGQSGAKQE